MTDDPDRAAEHVREELEGAPAGTMGTVRRVGLGSATPAEYVDLGEVDRAWSAGGGEVVWLSQRRPGAGINS